MVENYDHNKIEREERKTPKQHAFLIETEFEFKIQSMKQIKINKGIREKRTEQNTKKKIINYRNKCGKIHE